MASSNTPDPRPSSTNRPPCACGCGGTPRGVYTRFLPGHDAKALSARLAAERVDEPRTPCECGCGGIPRGRRSRFLPGHDQKLLSARVTQARDAATRAAQEPSEALQALLAKAWTPKA